MATESEKEALAGKYGMNMSDLEALLEANPELADSLSRSFGASLMPGMDVPRGQSVGPYGAYVASSPLSRLAQGGMEGYKVGAQQRGQEALLEALRGGGPAAGETMEGALMQNPGISAPAPMPGADQLAGSAAGMSEPGMGGMPDSGYMEPVTPGQGTPTPPPAPTLANPPAGAQPLGQNTGQYPWESDEQYRRRMMMQGGMGTVG